jgi:UDP-N-acetylmuramoyl-tripeptide--D-alanyl-D-alanine ligase
MPMPHDFCGATFDSRKVKPGMLFVALKGEKTDGHDFIPQALENGAAGVIDGYDELSSAAREYRKTLKAKVIAVTGSAGKTTTKEFLRAFFSKLGKTHATEGNFNNHIGLPITILNCPKDADYLIVEMGSNHPGEIAALCEVAAPDVGVVTNVGTAHLEFFGSREGIAAEKGELLKRAKVGFSAKSCEYLPGDVDTSAPWLEQALKGIFPGAHNVANASLAFAAAESFGLTCDKALEAIGDVKIPGARWRRVTRNGVDFIDDTYNASPDSMIAALETFAAMPCDGKHVAVLGDMLELGENSLELHQKVFKRALELKIPLVIGVGQMSSKCICNLAYKTPEALKHKFRFDVSSGDLVLVKASHSMDLGRVIDYADPSFSRG